jgi:hypothetical protein
VAPPSKLPLEVEAEGGETARHARPVTVAEALEASEAARRALLRCEGGAGPNRVSTLIAPAKAGDEPDLIFKRSTVFKLLRPNDKLATYGLDDPEVEGVACHFAVPERGGVKGWLGVAEDVSHFTCLSADRPDPLQGEVRTARRRV